MIVHFLGSYTYLGLLSLIFVEEAGIPLPLPTDILIATTAALPNSNYFLIIGLVTVSATIGSTILFTLSRKFGRRILIKYGPRLKISKEKIAKVELWFKKYGGFAIIIGRLIPGLRIVTPFVAGLFNVSYKTFWFYTITAAFIWANIYYIIGRFFLEAFQKLFR